MQRASKGINKLVNDQYMEPKGLQLLYTRFQQVAGPLVKTSDEFGHLASRIVGRIKQGRNGNSEKQPM